MQQDNDPKHRSKSTTEWLQQKKIRLLEWPSQSHDLNQIEMLWHDLKREVHTRHPKNTAELKQFCQIGMFQNSSWPLCRSDPQLQKTFGWGYCCQRRVNQLLNPRVPIRFPPCTVNVYTVCSIKTWKHIIVCVCYGSRFWNDRTKVQRGRRTSLFLLMTPKAK